MEGHAAKSLSLAVKTLKAVNRLSEREVPNKDDIIANLCSCIGNAHLELGQTDDALRYHQQDLEISKLQ